MKPTLCILLSFFILHLCPAQDRYVDDNGQKAAMEDVYRTSEQQGESGTGYRDRSTAKIKEVPLGSFRVGCECMDGTGSIVTGKGACSGHGGVRYWHYRTKSGDTLQVSTMNHVKHPKPLDAAEMSVISKIKKQRIEHLSAVSPFANEPQQEDPAFYLPAPSMEDVPAWMWPIALVITAIFLNITVRQILRWVSENPAVASDALSNILRHRKRPVARKNRKVTPKAGMP